MYDEKLIIPTKLCVYEKNQSFYTDNLPKIIHFILVTNEVVCLLYFTERSTAVCR